MSISLEVAVRSYRAKNLPHKKVEEAHFRSQPTLESAVRLAAFATDQCGKRYRHQTRIKRAAMEVAYSRMLVNLSVILQATTYPALLTTLSDLFDDSRKIKGLGKLYRYDTALRIGFRLGIEPDRVYLHAGTREGARRLGLPWKQESVSRRELPAALQEVRPLEAEDILCIYKDRF